jgi:hypothetical protein
LGGSWFKASQANSSQNCILKITRAKSTGGVAQAIEHPSSNFNTTTKKKKKRKKRNGLIFYLFSYFPKSLCWWRKACFSKKPLLLA